MTQLRKVLYTAQATVEGGREGSGRTEDDRLTVDLDVPTEMGAFGLAVTLDLDAPQLDREQASDLMARAHEVCPYSRATRGNISVELMVGGQAIAITAGVA